MIELFGQKFTASHVTLGLGLLATALLFVLSRPPTSTVTNDPDLLPLLETLIRESGGNASVCSINMEKCARELALVARGASNRSRVCQAELRDITNEFSQKFFNLSIAINEISTSYEHQVDKFMEQLNQTSADYERQLLNLVVQNNKTSTNCVQRMANLTIQLNKTRDDLHYHLSRGILVNGFCDAQVLQLHNCDRERLKSEDKIRDLSNRVGALQGDLIAARAESAAWDRMKTRLRSHREVFLGANTTNSNRHKQVAVCLPGQMRSSGVTHISLLAHFFHAFETYDIFVQTYPSDLDAARVFEPVSVGLSPTTDLPEGPIKGELWRYMSGLQGYLHQIHSITLCGQLIANYSRDTNTTYDWILRARADIEILDRLPLFNSLSLEKIYVLANDGYGGVNDKFFFGAYKPMLQLLASLYPGFYTFPKVLIPELYTFDKINELNMTVEVIPIRVKTVKMDGTWGAW